MIPDPILASASKAEKLIFNTFKSVAQRNWEILHKVEIPSHASSPNGVEIDFVILMPDFGSVICLQVVEDESYEFKEGKWSNNSDPSSKSPLERAKDVMASLRVRSHSSQPLSFGYAVVFKNDQELTLITEYNTYCKALDPNQVDMILKNYANYRLGGHLDDWDGLNDKQYAKRKDERQNAQLILNNLRTDLVSTSEIIATIATIFHDNLETHHPQLLRLTDDQLKVLQLVGCQFPTETDNPESKEGEPRCVVDGAAGTGKTVLAIEIARQRCEAGETVGLLCSNPYLSRRFANWTETLSDDNRSKVIVGTPATLPSQVFEENQDLAAKHQQRLDASSDLEGSLKLGYLDNGWQQFIAETIEDLNTLEQRQALDYLIVDEAQNLCDKVFLDLQDTLLKNGLKNGRWIMFGDFKNQNIVAPEIGQNGKDALRDFGLESEEIELEINCRNTHEITEKTFKLVGIESPPMLGVYGPHVQIEYFSEEKQLEGILDNLIDGWKNRSFQSRQIILLSSGTGGEFNTSRTYSGWQLLNIEKDASPGKDNTLRYSDVYDFQGLESDLAILVLPQTEDQVQLVGGLALPREKHLRRVLYTGMSRAKAMLVIVADELWRTTLERREFLRDKLTELQQAK